MTAVKHFGLWGDLGASSVSPAPFIGAGAAQGFGENGCNVDSFSGESV
jgi:hypothetical protein